jgi:hypothetical protein
MQEYRKIAADLAVFHPQQFLTRAPDHDPVAFFHWKSQQGVPNGSTNQIHLHG